MSEASNPLPRRVLTMRWGLVAVLAAIVAIAALPGYWGEPWLWQAELPVPQMNQLQEILSTPLSLPQWAIARHEVIVIGRKRWNLTEYQAVDADGDANAATMALLLRPQMSSDQQPEVEWVDLRGSQGWQVADVQTARWSVANSEGNLVPVTARYFRAINHQNTFGVIQWYAWSTGGHFAPARWFWADQLRQWRQQERMPWIAVSLLFPIEPVGDIGSHKAAAIAISQSVQKALLADTLKENLRSAY